MTQFCSRCRARLERVDGSCDECIRSELNSLRAKLAAAERERDEARAELREARIHLSVARREIDQSRASRPLLNPGPTLHGSTITEIATDRDRLATEVKRLTEERNEWRDACQAISDLAAGEKESK